MGRLNKPAKPGYKYESPNQTNANDLVPHPLEDVVASQRADARRIVRGLSPDASEGHKFSEVNRRRQQEAGGRGTIRTLGRMTPAGIAFEVGKKVGEGIDEAHPGAGMVANKLIEKSGLGKAIADEAVTPGRVELTDEAKERIRQERDFRDVEDAMRRADESIAREKAQPRAPAKEYKKGGMVGSASKRGDGIAQRGKTRGRMR